MPLNWQTFRTRAISAVVFVIVMLAGLLWNQWSFLVLFSIIHFGCWREYQKLVEHIDPGYKNIAPVHRYGIMLAGWGFMLWMTNSSFELAGKEISEAGFWIMVMGAIAVNIETLVSRRGKLVAHSLLGLIYISLSLGLLLHLTGEFRVWQADESRFLQFTPLLPLFIIACMWINDTMAYIVGSLIGRTPFSKISPKKTWEGTIGGVLLCVLVAGLAMTAIVKTNFPEVTIAPFHFYGMALVAAVFGTLGDLFESKLKRLAGVKDSGRMMPGHGGFLDRFDSLLLATPAVWLYMALFV